jgi:hypothetical protein
MVERRRSATTGQSTLVCRWSTIIVLVEFPNDLNRGRWNVTTKRTKSRLAGELGRFVQQYARKAKGSEPNDRQYDRKLERKMKQLSPTDLSDLLSEDEGESGVPRTEED